MELLLIYFIIGACYSVYFNWDFDEFFETDKEAKIYAEMLSDKALLFMKFASFLLIIFIWPESLLRKIYRKICSAKNKKGDL